MRRFDNSGKAGIVLCMTNTLPSRNELLFSDVVELALEAFLEDDAYAVAMIKRARAIIHKREVGAARAELKHAEREARSQCMDSEPFHCYNVGACGTGDCKFAHDGLVFVNIATKSESEKKRDRPQSSEHGPYALEDSVLPLYKSRQTNP
jgi:hypothetical protein